MTQYVASSVMMDESVSGFVRNMRFVEWGKDDRESLRIADEVDVVGERKTRVWF